MKIIFFIITCIMAPGTYLAFNEMEPEVVPMEEKLVGG
jgi:hypothetical protein